MLWSRWKVGVVCVTLGLLSPLLPAGPASAASFTPTGPLAGMLTQMQASLNAYTTQTSPSDPRYYSNGVWYATDGPACWSCYDTAAVGAATVGLITNNPTLDQTAITTFNTAIAQHQLPSGAFTDDTGAASQVDTGFFAVDLGVAALELHTVLPAATATTWANSLAAAANYLITSGATTWYINGNVNLRQTEVMWLAYAVTHQTTFLNEYNTEYTFTLTPPQSSWPGYGLHLTTTPTNPDGAGGAGYLAESNGTDTPGFDPNYTMAQLDTEADLYVLTHDSRYLYLMNLEYDQLAPLINPTTWILNATGGTRDSFMEQFDSPALDILATSGERPDLTPDLTPETQALDAYYTQYETLTNPNVYKGLESTLNMPIINAEYPSGLTDDEPAAPASGGTPAAGAADSPGGTPSSGSPATSPIPPASGQTAAGTATPATTTAGFSGGTVTSPHPRGVRVARGKTRRRSRRRVKRHGGHQVTQSSPKTARDQSGHRAAQRFASAHRRSSSDPAASPSAARRTASAN